MAYTFDDIDELDDFIINLTRSGGTGYFRGVEIRCDNRLGARSWVVYGLTITAFIADIGPDDLDYVRERLIKAGIPDSITA